MMNSSSSPHLYLVDASPYIFRAYFAVPDSIRTPAGQTINAAYGFANFLLQLLRLDDLTHLGVAFDESLNTSFRNELYPDYKAQRDLPPAELEAQLQACRDIAHALGVATFASPSFEADDLIGSLAHRFESEAGKITIVSSDKDLAQLVTEKAEFFDFAKKRRLDRRGVHELFGVYPEQMADYLGLVGDAVDNIPGVQGIGKKTAQTLLESYRDLESLYRDLDGVAELPLRGAKSIQGKLAAERDTAVLSKRLATIVADVPLDLSSLTDLHYDGADPDLVTSVFEELGFEGIRKRVSRWKGSSE